MITATEARKLTQESDKAIQDFLVKAEPLIRATAEKGENSVALYQDFPWESVPVHTTPRETPQQQRLVEAFKRLGFGAGVMSHGETYVPRGLADDDGNGPEHVNHVIVVSW